MPRIDDSALFHSGRRYDPAKARAYYLRTRHLKGRPKGSALEPTSGGSSHPSVSTAHKPSQNAELERQRAALEARFEKLQSVLAELVAAAKSRSGIETKTPEKTKKDSPDKKDSKKDDPKTAAEKKEAAKKARENYEKNRPKNVTPAKEIADLQAKIRDIKARIKAAMDNAPTQSSNQTASNGR